MARTKASRDHAPMPVSPAGVMLVLKIVPNGVLSGTPPAKFLPPSTVWQPVQLPIRASPSPCFTRARSKLSEAGGEIAASAERKTRKAAPVPANTRINATPVRTFRLLVTQAPSVFPQVQR